jgi:hypothetical protein
MGGSLLPEIRYIQGTWRCSSTSQVDKYVGMRPELYGGVMSMSQLVRGYLTMLHYIYPLVI